MEAEQIRLCCLPHIVSKIKVLYWPGINIYIIWWEARVFELPWLEFTDMVSIWHRCICIIHYQCCFLFHCLKALTIEKAGSRKNKFCGLPSRPLPQFRQLHQTRVAPIYHHMVLLPALLSTQDQTLLNLNGRWYICRHYMYFSNLL